MNATTRSADRPRVYLAGPEVFLPNAAELGAEKCRLASSAGFEGVFPLDVALDFGGLSPGECARRIALANETLIQSSDLLIANLTPFRGVSVDSGTAFEVGYMRALGRPVLGYTNTGDDFTTRSHRYRDGVRLPFDGDRPDVAIENFGLAENLMIAVAHSESGAEVIRKAKPLEEVTIGRLDGFIEALEIARRLFGLSLQEPDNARP